MDAVLWDGNKQINGSLTITKSEIVFTLKDFEETNLNLSIGFQEIKNVSLHRLYKFSTKGVEIVTSDNRVNVFIVSNPEGLNSTIKDCISKLVNNQF